MKNNKNRLLLLILLSWKVWFTVRGVEDSGDEEVVRMIERTESNDT